MNIIIIHNSFWGMKKKTESWGVFKEQLKGLIDVGLTKGNNRVICTGSSCPAGEQNRIRDWINKKRSKFEMGEFDVENSFEFPAFKTIYEEAHLIDENLLDDTVFMYFHTKGVTTGDKKLRQKLFKHMIENHEDYIKEFNNNPKLDVASLCPDKKGFGWYNFFWVRASYIKNYWKNPIKYRSLKKKDRYVWEKFCGCDYSTKPEEDIVVWSPATGYEKKDRSIIKDQRTLHSEYFGMTGEELRVALGLNKKNKDGTINMDRKPEPGGIRP